jgi:hypothetical protein
VHRYLFPHPTSGYELLAALALANGSLVSASFPWRKMSRAKVRIDGKLSLREKKISECSSLGLLCSTYIFPSGSNRSTKRAGRVCCASPSLWHESKYRIHHRRCHRGGINLTKRPYEKSVLRDILATSLLGTRCAYIPALERDRRPCLAVPTRTELLRQTRGCHVATSASQISLLKYADTLEHSALHSPFLCP